MRNSKTKIVVWAFYGSGKSAVADGNSIVDLDSVQYRFKNVGNDPHDLKPDVISKNGFFERDSEYPDNYIRAIQKSDADVVLVNCELPVLEKLENVVLFYPNQSLKQEFLERYKNRGDNLSFIYMIEQDYEGMIRSLGRLPCPKFVANKNKKYLSELLQGGKIDMSEFMIKKDLTHLIEQAKNFGLLTDYKDLDADEIAQKIFEGEIPLDTDILRDEVRKKQVEYEDSFQGTYVYEDDKKIQAVQVVRGGGTQTDEIWVRERKADPSERFQYYGFPIFDKDGVIPENFEKFQKMLKNGYQKTEERFEVGTIEKTDLEGYSFEDAVNLVMDAIACGVIQAEHGEVAPYSYGFNYRLEGVLSYDSYYSRYNGPFDAPKTIVRDHQLGKYPSLSFAQLEELVQQKQKELETVKITPYEKTEEYYYHKKNPRFYPHGLIANDKYIDSGYGVDGIIRGDCGGTYSSWTTGTQNYWMQAATALRGFCLDYIHDCLKEGKQFPYLDDIVSYYQSKGLDLNDEKQVRHWCAEHPNQCYSDKYLVKESSKEEMNIKKLNVFQNSKNDVHLVMDKIDRFMEEVSEELSGQDLVDAFSEYMKRDGIDVRVFEAAEPDEYFCDFDIGLLTVTFYINSVDRGHLMDGFEIWDDNGSYYGNYTKDEIVDQIEELQNKSLEYENNRVKNDSGIER